MNLTYAVADLHGAHDLLELALAAMDKHAAAAPAGTRTVVFLGDYIDRGSGSRQIIERLMAGPPEGWCWLCLKGNHEDMLIETVHAPLNPDWWLGSGGDATLASYDQARQGKPNLAVIPGAHIRWIAALPPIAVDQHRIFVHAAVNPTLPLDFQIEHDLLWSRKPNRLGYQGRFVVHGHTPHKKGPITDGQSIDLDTLAWHTGRLVLGVFDDDQPGGPIDLIEVRRAAGHNRDA